jgi:hypothetical protein
MFFLSRRAFPRDTHETPVRYEKIEEERFFESKAVNFSRGGLCIVSRHSLEMNDLVNVNMVDHNPGVRGPEQYYSFLGEIRWCKPILAKHNSSYGAGVRIMAKSREVPNRHLGQARYSCNLCGDFALTRHVTQILDHVYLCPYCYRHFNAIPHGAIRHSIERYLTGNVL